MKTDLTWKFWVFWKTGSLTRGGRNRRFDFIDKLTVLTTVKKTKSDVINILTSEDMEATLFGSLM